MISKPRAAAAGLFLLLASSCSGPKTAADAPEGSFNYAPALDRPSHETMHRLEEVAIPGTPIREAEEWTMDWDVVTKKDGENYKRSLKLVGLKIDVNGAPLLKGDEVKAAGATVDIITDKASQVVDVRGADQLSAAIVGLGAPEAQPVLRRVFSPERLRLLAAVRSMELHEDFVGRPAKVGSSWTAKDAEGGGAREIRVVSEAPCGSTNQCVHVVRKYEIDKKALYAEVSDRIAGYVKEQGGDPAKVEVVGMDLKLEDSLLIEPATMDHYGAKFDQQATIRVAGPNGELPVSVKVQRQTEVRF
jgi:hypothetical protein